MSYSIHDITRLLKAEGNIEKNAVISQLLTDSRQLIQPEQTLFFAIPAHRRDGHDFIQELYEKGVRNFVISQPVPPADFPDANFLKVNDSLHALQQLAAWHRSKFNIPVIGITGSNGKTVVKEWLYQLLYEDFQVVRSPKSYNSQVGVPLSIWQMNEKHQLAIFEAGISKPGEMEKLEEMIRPGIGILTSFGEAHSEGFTSPEEKIKEKTKLFARCQSVVFGREMGPGNFNLEQEHIATYHRDDISFYHWSRNADAWLTITGIKKTEGYTIIQASHKEEKISIEIPFTDDASIENAISCWSLLMVLGVDQSVIRSRMKKLQPVNMRLELKKGRNGCAIINDSYSADLSSLGIALDFMDQQKTELRKTVILSDFLQSSMDDDELYRQVLAGLKKHSVTRLIGIGERISRALRKMKVNVGDLQPEFYPDTEEFLRQLRSSRFRDEIILVKGARVFEFERIVQVLEQKSHQTVLEIDLNAISHNLKQYQSRLKPGTRVMAMVKAFAYGSGGAEIAGILQYHKIDYLGVAYADEGVDLRRAGISVPVMVMNPEENTFSAIVENRLEPEIYSFELLEAWEKFLQNQGLKDYPIHIEIETGMNRLGFAVKDMEVIGEKLKKGSSKLISAFSHFASSEDPKHDDFTRTQFDLFIDAVDGLEKTIGYSFFRHIANSAAILRHPYAQLDMVRLGIGLYGVDQSSSDLDLQTVATLRSTIAQVKDLVPGESVSYNRKGMVDRKTRIATIRIGYADGYPRRLGNGRGKVWLRGKLVPLIGSVCMDMIMVDITGLPDVKEGDEVIIFGRGLPVQELAVWADTIPYEIMTGISQRVKRVYFME